MLNTSLQSLVGWFLTWSNTNRSQDGAVFHVIDTASGLWGLLSQIRHFRRIFFKVNPPALRCSSYFANAGHMFHVQCLSDTREAGKQTVCCLIKPNHDVGVSTGSVSSFSREYEQSDCTDINKNASSLPPKFTVNRETCSLTDLLHELIITLHRN